MAPARLAESIKRFEQQSMSQHVITAEVAAEKFKKTDVHGNQSLSDKGARRVERAVDAEQRNGDAINDSVSLHASVEVRDAADAGFGDANDAATAPVEHAPTVSIGRIKSFEDFNDDGSLDGDATTNLDNVDEDDDAAALLDPESDVAHFGRRSSGGIDRVNSNADDVEPYTPPGTPPPLTPSDDEQEEAGVGKSSRPSVNAQTALFGVNIDMDNLRADGTLNCRGKLPLTVVRALSPKMSVVGRMEMDKCDSYLEALSTSSSRDRALCFVSASSADARDKLARIAQTLRERSRVGVVKLAKSNPNLRECFLIPWNGTDPLPSFLTRFPTLVPQLSDDAPLIVVLVLSKQPGASGIASGLLTSDGAVPTPVVRAAPPVVRAPQPSVATVMAPPPVPAPTAPLNVGGGGAASLSSALSSLAASLASGGGASLLAAMRGGAQPQPPPQQPQQLHPQPHQQLQPQQQVLPHQLHQQHLQQQQQMRQQHILQMQQQQQQQHHHFMPQQHQPPPQQQQQHLPPLLPRPNAPLLPLPVDPRTGLPLPRNPPQHGW
jgi:hypothetical protein